MPLGGGAAREVTDPTASYLVQVERDLPFDAARVGSRVDRVLTDQRGWLAAGDRLVRVEDPALADIRIVLATPETTDQLCAPLDTAGRLSCRVGPNVAINGWRWANGAPAYGGDLGGYRTYVINHEVGHALGNPHVGCPAPQALAPVMVQQTIGLEGCRSNPWPARADLD